MLDIMVVGMMDVGETKAGHVFVSSEEDRAQTNLHAPSLLLSSLPLPRKNSKPLQHFKSESHQLNEFFCFTVDDWPGLALHT